MKGLVLPPKVAQIQVVVVPCGITVKTASADRVKVYEKAEALEKALKASGIRAKADLRDNYTPGYKFNDWELRGVPIRLEVGPKDLAKNEVRCVKRYNSEVSQISMNSLESQISAMLESIQAGMFAKAKSERDARLIRLETWDRFVEVLNQKCIILSPWCEEFVCEESVKERSSRT